MAAPTPDETRLRLSRRYAYRAQLGLCATVRVTGELGERSAVCASTGARVHRESTAQESASQTSRASFARQVVFCNHTTSLPVFLSLLAASRSVPGPVQCHLTSGWPPRAPRRTGATPSVGGSWRSSRRRRWAPACPARAAPRRRWSTPRASPWPAWTTSPWLRRASAWPCCATTAAPPTPPSRARWKRCTQRKRKRTRVRPLLLLLLPLPLPLLSLRLHLHLCLL